MANELIHIRMPAAEVDALRAAAEANSRTLQDEIRHRLRTADKGQVDGGGLARALGDLVVNIVRYAEVQFGSDGSDPQKDDAIALGITRRAIDRTLASIPNPDPSPDDETAGMIASMILPHLYRPQPDELPDWRWDQIREGLATVLQTKQPRRK